jgi:hypothetical protein
LKNVKWNFSNRSQCHVASSSGHMSGKALVTWEYKKILRIDTVGNSVILDRFFSEILILSLIDKEIFVCTSRPIMGSYLVIVSTNWSDLRVFLK